MRSQIRLGSVLGIRIGLHYSWFLIALLIATSIYGQFRIIFPQWTPGRALGLAIATALLFFVSLVLHELSHSLVARSQGIPVREITLFALGGVSQIEKGATTAKAEFWMAFVGPLTSACIGLICWALSRTPGLESEPLRAMLAWLAYINFALAIFNMLPGFPLDGGRVLRAAIWWATGNVYRATRWAARVGQVVAVILILIGIFDFFTQDIVGGMWMVFLGWFLLMAASESSLEAGFARTLRGVSVGDAMIPLCPTIRGDVNLQDFVEDELLPRGSRCYLVAADDGTLAGLVTPHDIRNIPHTRWADMTVADIMRPFRDLRIVAPETPLMGALDLMSLHDLNQLPVISDGHLAGVISRSQLLNYLRTKEELEPV